VAVSFLARVWRGAGAARRPGAGGAGAAVGRALRALLRHDLALAEAELVAAARAWPEDVELRRALAAVLRERGDHRRALQLHRLLLLRHDLASATRTELLADLAEDHQRAGLLRRAVAAWDEVLAREPRHAGALRGLARLLTGLREHERAARLARRLSRVERGARSEEAALLLEHARVAQAEGRSEDALRALRRIARLRRDWAPALVLLGSVEAERGRQAAALEAWRRAVGRDPACGPFVYPRMEAALSALGRSREFESAMRSQLERRPEDVPARLALARSLAARGDTDGALEQCRLCLERRPESAQAEALLVRVLLERGDDAEARPVLADLLARLERSGPGVEPESSA